MKINVNKLLPIREFIIKNIDDTIKLNLMYNDLIQCYGKLLEAQGMAETKSWSKLYRMAIETVDNDKLLKAERASLKLDKSDIEYVN